MFGIHIGNTNVSIAFCKENGNVTVITNEGGDRLTPAVVAVTEEEILVGTSAKLAQMSNIKSTITHNKSMMGKDKLDDIKHHNNVVTEVDNNEIKYRIPVGEKMKYFTPQNITMFIFKDLLSSAKSVLGVDSSNLSCVLLVPGNYSDSYCEKYKQAAESAGWIVMQVINEAAAALLAFPLLDSKDEPPQNIVVYRLGGSTCEITGCEIYDGMITILGSTHGEHIGGDTFIDALVEFYADEFLRKYKLDPRENIRSVEKLKRASQNCIHVLSNLPTSNCFIESLYDGIDFSIALSRARFEIIIKPLLVKCIEPLKTLLSELKFNGPVDKVLLCGGTTNIPSLKQSISTVFHGTTAQILTHNNPEEVLVIGGAKQAHYLNYFDCQEMLPRSMQISLETADFIYEDCD